jgi:hypothetical protein
MAKHTSTREMLFRLRGLTGTSDLTAWEEAFVESISRHYTAGTLGDISDKQVETLENLFNKHFA